jgi:hypothetical protein
MRVTIEEDPFAHVDRERTLWSRGTWPARWVRHPEVGGGPVVVAYRVNFRLEGEETFRLHVSADERYQLWLDGVAIGRGPERGDADHWFFETYEVTVPRGRHVLVARVWSLGDGRSGTAHGSGDAGAVQASRAGEQVAAPYAQISVGHGLLVASDEALLPLVGTGVAAWEAMVLPGYEFHPPGWAWGTGARASIRGSEFAWNFQRGDGKAWVPVVAGQAGVAPGRMEAGPSQLLRPGRLPGMIERYVRAGRVRHVSAVPPEVEDAEQLSGVRVESAADLPQEREAHQRRLENRQPMRFQPFGRWRIIIDLEDYYCVYPVVVTTGGDGGSVSLRWAESLHETADAGEKRKGDRNAVEGKYFLGVGETFWPDGGVHREFETLWWEAGRYLELFVETVDEPLELNLILKETRYPLEMVARFESSDPRLGETVPVLMRGLQMCAHETYVDCPYYEQLMYVGDARLEALITYAVSGDDRLARKAIAMFDASRGAEGLVQSRYPSRVRQVIPPFALLWVGMVHDFAMWRDDPAFVRSMMKGVRAAVDAFAGFRNADGLVEGPRTWWNFVDWVPGWKNGVPPDGEFGVSCVINWQFVCALRWAQEMEERFGEPELAARCDRLAREVAGAVERVFWEPVRRMFADDAGRTRFSEHAQCLAILSGALDQARCAEVAAGLLTSDELARTTIYFSHYLFEAYREIAERIPAREGEATRALFERLALWFGLRERGFVTPFEEPEPSRSDCHGWGSHPLFHYFATVLGVRPGEFGFGEVEVAPRLGHLTEVKGRMPHPAGEIEVELRREGGGVRGRVVLPEEVSGRFRWGGRVVELRAGENAVEMG